MAAGPRPFSRAHSALKLVHDAENESSDAFSPGPRTKTDGADTDFAESSFCAFCAAPIPESGEPCCADYAATLQVPPFGVGESYAAPPREPAAPPVPPVPRVASERTSGARSLLASYGLFVGLVFCICLLGVALIYQGQIATERTRELEETRRLSEEMIALMKETRREAAERAAVPSAGEVVVAAPAAVPAGEAGAPTEIAAVAPPVVAAPVVAAPPVAAPFVAAPPVAVSAEKPSNSVSPAKAASPDLAPPPSVDQPASPVVPPPRTFAERIAMAEQGKTRRPAVVAKVPEKAAEPVREFAIIPSMGDVSPPPMPKLRPAEPAFRQSAAIPPAVKNAALPPRPPLVSPWMKIMRGMSQREVRRLLGEPRSTEQLMTGEFWYYGEHSMLGRGWVAFSEVGVVIEWLNP